MEKSCIIHDEYCMPSESCMSFGKLIKQMPPAYSHDNFFLCFIEMHFLVVYSVAYRAASATLLIQALNRHLIDV